MRYVGLDVSYRNVGVVILDSSGELSLRESLVCEAVREPDGFAWHRRQAESLFLPDDVVAIEGQAFGAFSKKSMVAGAHAVWLETAVAQTSLVFVPPPKRGKKWATNDGKATKAQMKAWARAELGLPTSRAVKFTEHEADALALAQIARAGDRLLRKRYVDIGADRRLLMENKKGNGVIQVPNQSVYRGFYGQRYESLAG